MKKRIAALSLLLVIAILMPMTAIAATEKANEDIYTVVTVDGSSYVMDDAPSVEDLGSFDSYTVVIGTEAILDVSLSSNGDPDGSPADPENPTEGTEDPADPENPTEGTEDPANPENPTEGTEDPADPENPTEGTEDPTDPVNPIVPVPFEPYYTVRFDLPDTTKKVVLNGLVADKVEEIQEILINSYLTSSAFDLDDVSFIDAEKVLETEEGADVDDDMCWAASASNLLTYTGWAAQAGFSSTDDVFEAYIDAFENNAGNPFYGLSWFFSGVNQLPELIRNQYPDNPEIVASVAQADEGTGRYLPDYAFEQFTDIVDMSEAGLIEGMAELRDHLDRGDGIALTLSLYRKQPEIYSNDHAVTCWGYVIDTAYGVNEIGYNAGVFLTDSDSDKMMENRREAPNTLHVVSLTTKVMRGELRYIFEDSQYTCALVEFTYLRQYSDELPKETDPDATRDRITTPDLYIGGAYLGTDFTADPTRLDTIESNTRFYYTPIIRNLSDPAYSDDDFEIVIEIVRSDGKTVLTQPILTSITVRTGRSVSFSKSLTKRNGLPAGDYTMTFTLNPDHTAAEAFYYNNTYSFDFKVRDSYLAGDVNGDGTVSILDATAIQYLLAGDEDYLAVYPDGYLERAVLDGGEMPNITFATEIQRWLVDYEVAYPIGEKRLYH